MHSSLGGADILTFGLCIELDEALPLLFRSLRNRQAGATQIFITESNHSHLISFSSLIIATHCREILGVGAFDLFLRGAPKAKDLLALIQLSPGVQKSCPGVDDLRLAALKVANLAVSFASGSGVARLRNASLRCGGIQTSLGLAELEFQLQGFQLGKALAFLNGLTLFHEDLRDPAADP